jgi:hypothetical protein
VHYAIGIIYAGAYLILIVALLKESPTLVSAVVFGVATVAAPWFILQPGLGLGVFARRAPRPNVVRLSSLSVHTVFGASLFFGDRIFAYLF